MEKIKALIIVEKRDVGYLVSEALYNLGEKSGDFMDKWETTRANTRTKSYLESDNYVIVWTIGHMASKLNTNRYKTLKLLQDLIEEHQFKKVIICTDADLEGELIARHALEVSGLDLAKADIRRFWITGAFNSVPSIEENLKNAKPYTDKKYEDMYQNFISKEPLGEKYYLDFLNGDKLKEAIENHIKNYDLKLTNESIDFIYSQINRAYTSREVANFFKELSKHDMTSLSSKIALKIISDEIHNMR